MSTATAKATEEAASSNEEPTTSERQTEESADIHEQGKLTSVPAGLRSIRDIVKDLSKPVAKRHLKTRKQGGRDITYIAWHDAIKYLDHYAPGWNYEIRSVNSIGGKLILITRISVPCAEGIVYREATGQEDETLESYGDSSSNSESMSLRRCAAKFGVGIDLYSQNK